MKRYSVWSPTKRTWEYYQAAGDLRAGVIAPPPKMARGHKLGLSPEEAARALPVGAKLIGGGPQPVGMVAGRKQGMGLFGIGGGTLLRVAVWGAIGYGVWTYVLNDSRRRKTRRFLTGR